MPTYVGKGAAVGSLLAITPALPAGIQTNDILLLVCETFTGNVISIANANGGTWTEVTGSPIESVGTRVTVFWSRYNGTQGDPTTNDSGNHNFGIIHAFRGIKTSGNPFNITSGNFSDTNDTALSATGATTTVADCLVVICANLDGSVADFGATWTNADLASITVRSNDATIEGNDGRIGVVTGEKATAGAYGATTNTLTAASTDAAMTIALEGAGLAVGRARIFIGPKLKYRRN